MLNHATISQEAPRRAVEHNPWQDAADYWEAAAGTNVKNAETYKAQARICRGVASVAETEKRYRAHLRGLILQGNPYSLAKEQARRDIYGL